MVGARRRKLLSRYYRVIRFDHRGIGRSGKGEADRYTTRLFAEDAAAVLTAAGADLAHVYGHSMGGRVGQWLAIDYPQKVRTLILAATSGGKWPDAGTQPDKAALEALVSGDMSRLEPLFFDAEWVGANPVATHTFFNSQPRPGPKRVISKPAGNTMPGVTSARSKRRR